MTQTLTPTPTPTPTPELNISQLTDQLWTGGDLPPSLTDAAAVVEQWHRLGIRAIVDARFEWTDADLVASSVAPDIAYLNAGVDDAGQTMPDWWFDKVTAFALEHLDRGGVLVHCHMGINRGPSAAFAVLLATGRDPVEAIDLIRTARPISALGYAEDALNWWHRRVDLAAYERVEQRSRLRRWRADHPHDTVRIIRQIRAAERQRTAK